MPERSPGRRLADAFRQATAKRPDLHEDELLRQLRASLAAMAAAEGLSVEGHDGQRTYVAFEPSEELGGGTRRCELADLLVLAYRPASPPALRFFVLQTRRRSSGLPRVEGDVPLARARTNVFHWDLLHRRPRIEPVGKVRPPADLLAGARQPSVGCFGFFHRPPALEGWELHLASAEVVRPWGSWPPAEKPRRTARFPDVTAWRRGERGRSALSAAGLVDVGYLLVEGALGAPLALPPANEHDRLTASWLAAVLADRVHRAPTGEAELARELHERLTGSLKGGGLVDLDSRVGAPPLVIVRSDRIAAQG